MASGVIKRDAIGIHNLGEYATLENLQSAFIESGSSMKQGEAKSILFAVGVSYGIFPSTWYDGLIFKHQINNRLTVIAFASNTNNIYLGNYNGSWSWKSLS